MNDFWIVFAAVLDAGLLIVAFVWACFNISRKEQRQESIGIYLSVFLTVIGFAALASYIAFGGR